MDLPMTMNDQESWRVWEKTLDYGELLYRRATGELEEMESSKALCQVLSGFYAKGMKVLDVGCGAGHYLRSLRKRVDPDIDYSGVDATAKYVALARKAYNSEAMFRQGDIYNLPFPDRSFDIVICNNVLLHLPPPPVKPISELYRVAKKYAMIRTVFGERNYIIKELRTAKEIEGAPSAHLSTIQLDGSIPFYNYFNMYTEQYFSELVSSLTPAPKVQIIKDTFWQSFDNRQEGTTATATRVMDGKQVSGNLILDFRFIVLEKPNA